MTYGDTICSKRYYEQRDPSCALCAAPPTLELIRRCTGCGMNLCPSCENGSHTFAPSNWVEDGVTRNIKMGWAHAIADYNELKQR